MREFPVRLKPDSSGVLARTIDGETVLVHSSTGAMFHLNRVAGSVWSLMEAAWPLEQIANQIAAAYSAPADQVRADLARLARQLMDEKLVVDGDGSPVGQAPPIQPDLPYSAPALRVHHLNVYDRLKVNTAEVASKIIDGEAILINVANGTYYSLDGAGSVLWSLIQSEQSIETMVDTVAEIYRVPKPRVRQDLEEVARVMMRENLIHLAGGPAPGAPAIDKPQGEYQTPGLNIYRDMEDLLALDPPMPTAQDVAAAPRDMHLGKVDWQGPR